MIYFDNAATSRYKPKKMIAAMLAELKRSANGGRSGHRDAVETTVKITHARTFFKNLLSAQEVVFTKNCTEAANLALCGTLKKGDHVVTTVNEHNSILRPLFRMEKEGRIKLSIVNPDRNLKISAQHIERVITPDTSLIAVNAVSNVTGAQSDISSIGEVAKKYRALLFVDGAQWLPHDTCDMSAQNIAFLACAGHKGFHGPQGTGFLAINSDAEIRPLITGGTGTNSDSVYPPYTLPEALEAGTLNSAGIIGLHQGALWTAANAQKINEKVHALNEHILYGIKSLSKAEVYTPDGCQSGVISFNIKGASSSEIGDILNERYNIAVRTGLHCAPLIHNYLGTLERGAVRVSIGYNNSKYDAEALLRALKEICENY